MVFENVGRPIGIDYIPLSAEQQVQLEEELRRFDKRMFWNNLGIKPPIEE